ncbi:MAG TPA: HPF/RaiA family ribosome-associated protein [Steroidobacteraceae bacterium]|nr:HPF/RaiA family ribosome-associated protein [Steroidobacteraceae bacterium]
MKLPLQITFRHMAASPALESRIRELTARFEKFSDQIVRCHVIVEPLSRHQRHGSLYEFHVHITLPDEEIAIRRAHPGDHSHEDAYVALRDAFRAARRQLQDYERKRRRDVKVHAGPAQGWIWELDGARGFGRIEAEDGRLIYFHRNSVVGKRFEDLSNGAAVQFTEEPGDLGPQASTVHVEHGSSG